MVTLSRGGMILAVSVIPFRGLHLRTGECTGANDLGSGVSLAIAHEPQTSICPWQWRRSLGTYDWYDLYTANGLYTCHLLRALTQGPVEARVSAAITAAVWMKP